jgi:glutathione S-transferase
MYTLYIGNKNYSSWSLRGWLAVKLAGAPLREIPVQLVGRGPNPANRAFSPSGLVPCLHDGDAVVWDTLAIGEYLAERHAGLWPADAKARAHARCTAAEMHSGFGALRSDMSMCIRERVDVQPWSDALTADIERITALWTEARSRFGRDGAFLYGAFSLADCFYAPVVFRFQTYQVPLAGVAGAYAAAMRAHPLLREWEAAALAETTIIEADEPRVIYRDKLARRGA